MQTVEMTKEEALFQWCKTVRLFNSVHAKMWGLDNFYSRADRTIRDFVTEGKLRRLDNEEIILKGLRKKGNAPLAWYEVI